ncbi:hypothetical protein [Pseudomonas auratipiscis]|uniref:Uncharacterized protein n=1 Tax=Pseudomonas auratipiscis TaxID=3115853 RepID=A0AB35WYB6_9PSED|nr:MULTISPECIES: hypothetical protein [unclassified Pseudomonas]MEE1869437.1 hypothetical protein [Pseudomonas sp. 120P]MEE1958958.1 hypothetical protein [Pseudomonas sp. 119P]
MRTDNYSVWMAAGTLLLIAPEVSLSERQAVLDSLLYAQLVANKAVGSRFADYPQWYSRYRHGLSARDWILTQLFQDTHTPSGRASMVAPIQPLALWLEGRHAGASSVVEQGLQALGSTQGGLDIFRPFAFEGDASGTRIALEIGLVHKGPIIDMCSIALQTSLLLEQVTIEQPLYANTIQGDVLIKGQSAQLDCALFEPRREELRRLIERKQQERCYLLELGKKQGGNHE